MLSAPQVRSNPPSSVRSPFEARKRVGRVCRGLSAPLTDTAELLVSELVTHALVRGRAVGLRLSRDEHLVRVEVSDPATASGVSAAHLDLEVLSGRGRFLLAALAHSWGSEPATRGGPPMVWFELHLRDF